MAQPDASGPGQRPAESDDAPSVGPVPEPLRDELQALGLSAYETRLLVALLRIGSGTVPQLSRVSGVHRTSTYQVLDSLGAKGLAERVPGVTPAVWASPGRDKVMERIEAALEAVREERRREETERTDRVRNMLTELLPEAPSVALPYVHVIHEAKQAQKAYERILAEAKSELAMFTRPPYSRAVEGPSQAVLDMLSRKVSARVLYQGEQIMRPEAKAFRKVMAVYHDAGVEARMMDDLPLKLVIVDRKVVLVGMNDPIAPEAGFPMTLLIEHPGYARINAVAFDQLWAVAQPYQAPTGDADEDDVGEHGEEAAGGYSG